MARAPGPVSSEDLARAARLLRPGGVIASNTLDETAEVRGLLGRKLPGLVQIDVHGYDNRILLAGPRALSGRMLRDAVRANSVLRASAPRLRFRTLTR